MAGWQVTRATVAEATAPPTPNSSLSESPSDVRMPERPVVGRRVWGRGEATGEVIIIQPFPPQGSGTGQCCRRGPMVGHGGSAQSAGQSAGALDVLEV